MAKALPHLRVVELCDDIPGAYCARQFAAWSAAVTVIQLEAVPALRSAPPLVADSAGKQTSLLWEFLAAGKCLVEPASGGPSLSALVAGADVFVTDWSDQRLRAHGLRLDALAARAPGLVVISISPYGSDGPYASWAGIDLTVQALSGFMNMNGLPDAPPLKAPANILAYACGVGAFVGALAALYERGRSGLGQRVELSCLELVTTTVALLRVQYSGQSNQRQGGPGAFTSLYPCRDGYVAFTTTSPGLWEHLVQILGATEEDVPAELRTPEGRRDREAVRRFIEAWTPRHSARTLFNAIGALGERCGIIHTPGQLLSDPHLRGRGFFAEVDHPRLAALTFTGPPGKMSLTPMVEPALAQPGVSPETSVSRERLPSTTDAPSTLPPLHGVRLVDLTQAWVGPYATQLLADLGADVIKVESHKRPDVWRGSEAPLLPLPPGTPAHVHHWNASAAFNMVNRNKRDLALDLDTAEGKQLFLKLVERADLVMENYTPRVMPNFGLDFERLRQVKPDLVMVSFSGYGAMGPYRDFKANGATTEATSGWDALLGYPGGLPLALGGMQADAITGLQCAALALVALLHRQQTGMGQWVDGSMYEAAAGYIGEQVLHASVVGEQASRQGNRHAAMAPHNAFPCTGEDEWIAIAVRDDRDWAALLTVAGGEAALDDPRFQTASGRQASIDTLEAAVARWTARHDRFELADRLQAAGVPAAAVHRDVEVLRDPQLTARGWFKPMTHADMGTQLHHGTPWRFSRTPPVCRTPSPRLGEHSTAVLAAELSLSAAEIERLIEIGVTGAVLSLNQEQAVAG